MIKYEIKVEECKTQCTIEQIREFEQFIHKALPQDYIDFLLQYNGGHPIQDTYDLIEPINGKDEVADIAWFFAIYDGDVSNLHKEYLESITSIPRDFLAIAYGSGGDLICINLGKDKYGKVYFWDVHDQAPHGEEPWYDNIYLIANSFKEFIDKLYEVELDKNGNLVRIDNKE